MSKKELTQEKLNEIFEKDIKPEWDRLVDESGLSEEMAILTGGDEIKNFLVEFQDYTNLFKKQGLVMPELVKGLTITFESK